MKHGYMLHTKFSIFGSWYAWDFWIDLLPLSVFESLFYTTIVVQYGLLFSCFLVYVLSIKATTCKKI